LKEAAIKVACELKKQGILSSEQIAQVTGLTTEEINQLKC